MNLTRYLCAVLILLTFTVFIAFAKSQPQKLPIINEVPELYPYPVAVENPHQPPEISASSAIVIDSKTAIELFTKNPDTRHLPASTTKLMTAIVALEKCDPEQVIRVGKVVGEGTQMGLTQGDLVTVKDLLYGLLVASGNDAAFVLADSCSDSSYRFVESMNQKAKELKMENSHFLNPAGFDDPLQYSSARDLAKLAKVAVASPLISKIVATKNAVLNDVNGFKIYYLENINELLGEIEGVEGVKTGQTEGSLEVLITKTTRNDHTITAVVLGSYDRFGESKQLIEWAFTNHQWLNPQ